MQLETTITGVREAVEAARAQGKRIGFVPTMGFLHEGHRSLMRQAREECPFVVVSIFVNPTQFGPNEDFDQYPRDMERDAALCRSVPVDLIFNPSVSEMYPQPFLTRVRVSGITDTLCGASRPGHFEGVATVVTKLFGIVRPDVAYFGQKDAQQVAVIRRMTQDLNLDAVAIRTCPTYREPDGLAMSSRNVYLSPSQREAALVLSRALRQATQRVAAGERDMGRLKADMYGLIAAEPLASVDYVEIVDMASLQPLKRLESIALAAIAVKFGKTRLIDNTILQA